MNEREELKQIILDHPEICEELLALLRLLRGQTLPPATSNGSDE